jgi:AbrB family looped-hinge helix DNA binding protein
MRAKPCVAEIRQRGQITIPKSIRETSHLEEGQTVTLFPLGNSIIITPKRLELDEARRQMKKILQSSGVTVEELLEGLAEDRAELYGELYGDK